jgi:hypothetical protein
MNMFAKSFLANKVDVFSLGVTMLEVWLRGNNTVPFESQHQKLLLLILAMVHPFAACRLCPFTASQLWKGVYNPSVTTTAFKDAVLHIQNFELEATLVHEAREGTVRKVMLTAFQSQPPVPRSVEVLFSLFHVAP